MPHIARTIECRTAKCGVPWMGDEQFQTALCAVRTLLRQDTARARNMSAFHIGPRAGQGVGCQAQSDRRGEVPDMTADGGVALGTSAANGQPFTAPTSAEEADRKSVGEGRGVS